MSKVNTAIILAGGLGTRLRSVVSELPKPMANVSGRPFLEHLMDYWLAQGVTRFILSVGYQSDIITAHFGPHYRHARIDYAIESEPLGTGGGFFYALREVDETVLVLNGDTFFSVALDELADFHKSHASSWTFSLFRTDYNGRYMGMKVAENGVISAFKSNDTEPGRLANGGVYLVEPSAIKQSSFHIGAKFSLEDELLPELLTQGIQFYGMECSGRFIDIGIPEDYFRAANVISG